MEITCFSCHQTWQLTSGQYLLARLKFALGAHEHEFVCPHCQAKNLISKDTFRTSDPYRPVAAENDPEKPIHQHPPRAANDPAPPPTNPITAPEPAAKALHAIVLERGLPLRREHHRDAEIMGALNKDEHVIILDTWSNGDELWIQLGPERWCPIEQNGEALIQLLDD